MVIRSLFCKFPEFFTKSSIVNIFLFTNSLVWYLYAFDLLENSIAKLNLEFTTNLLIWSTFFISIIVSALIGAFLTKRLGGRTRFLLIWLILGTIVPFASFVINVYEISGIILLCLLFGFSFGFGMPNYMGYFVSQTAVENRGKVGGFMILFTGLGTIGLTRQLINIDNIILLITILAVWRAIGLAVFLLFRIRNNTVEETIKTPSYRKLIGQRSFILYLVPWIMFVFNKLLRFPVQDNDLQTSYR